MNYLVTLNIGNVLTQNSRESMQAAAERWGCLFIEIKENLVGNHAIHFNKYRGAYNLICDRHNRADSIMFIDADTMIRSDAPNPFELFQGPYVFGVLDSVCAPDQAAWRADVIGSWLWRDHERLRRPIPFEALQKSADLWFINAGVWIVNPGAYCCLTDFLSNMASEPGHGRTEQSLWNYVCVSRDAIRWMPLTWNKIQPDLSSGQMQDYVYHFTGPNDYEKVKAAVGTYDWRTIP